ncbi:hypothetical protein [Saccharicrinis aurantiacus]|uniref:hypothetical protein n=1 Tax=Saccharicrinis aurantiacus TaxID=1849719 RepID=UPI00248F650F|nr:hypothetical protein [Saccharicrinis aurantiacus]
MKQQTIGFCMLLLGLTFSLTSCYEEVDADKYSVPSPELVPTLTTVSDSVSFDSFWLDTEIKFNGDEEILESGYLVCTDKNFPDSLLISRLADYKDNQMSAQIDLLVGNTQYYYKAYTYTLNGFAFGDVGSITTTESPIFEDTYLFGKFNQIDYSIRDGVIDGDDNNYWAAHGTMEISQVEGTYNQIAIYNFWGYGRTIIAVVNFEDKTLEISPAEIAFSSQDGPLYIYSWSMDGDYINIHLEEAVKGTYDENGNIKIEMWGAFANTSSGYLIFEACTETHLIKRDEEITETTKMGTQRASVNNAFTLPVILK